MAQHQFKINLPGLLKLLGSNIYSSPEVAVREMIQNAHDTCIIRSTRDSSYKSPRILVSYDWEELQLRFSDNGAGMTEKELHAYLATIGAGFTKIERDRLRLEGAIEARLLIGQFGIGMLAAFSVAARVEVLTRSYLPKSVGLKWTCEGDIQYNVENYFKSEPGTDIVLHLTTRGLPLLEDARLTQAIKKYADFLSIPIFLKGQQVNACVPPWETQLSTNYESYIQSRYGLKALTVIPVSPPSRTLISALLFVPALPPERVRNFGDVDVYISRAFVKSGEQNLLPNWAQFVKGVVNTDILVPIASRDDFQRDPDSEGAIRNALGDALLTHLHRLAVTDGDCFDAIVGTYSNSLKAASLTNDDLLDIVGPNLRVMTDTGSFRLIDYMAVSKGTLFYTTQPTSSVQQRLLSDKRQVPIIDASFGIEQEFLKRYASRRNISLTRGSTSIDTERLGLNEDLTALEDRFRLVLRNPVKVVRFEPISIPAIMGESHALVRGDVAGDASVEETRVATLHVNISNPLIEQLSTVESEYIFGLAARALWDNAALFARQYISAEGAELIFATSCELVSTMISNSLALKLSEGTNAKLRSDLNVSDARASIHKVSPFRSCFFAFDYKVADNYALFDQLQEYFVKRDLGVKLLAPVRGIDDLNLVKSMHDQMLCVHFGVADITSNNPNVLYEAGILKGLGKPVLYLRNEEDVSAVPFDIYSDYRVEYRVLKKSGRVQFAWIDEALDSVLKTVMRNAPEFLSAAKWIDPTHADPCKE